MHTDTLIWLFPIVFMIHDFEEIILMTPWIRANRAELERRWPRLAPRMLAATGGLSTAAFALAVAILFLAISTLTVIVVERHLYALWSGMVLIFALHFLMHIGQWLVMRRYVPVIVTSLLSIPYWGYGLWHAFAVLRIAPADIALNALLSAAVFAAVFALALQAARAFDRWQGPSLP